MSFENDPDQMEQFPLADASDAGIIMHRDAHFGGNFELMLDYYKRGGKGVHPDFELERIQELADLERTMNQNLAGLLLSGSEAEKVARSKEAYKQLRSLYDVKKGQSKHPTLIADLILSEDEEAEQEIAAIIKEKGLIVPSLLELIKSEDFHDALFPGYGFAPKHAIKAIGMIGDKRAIITLFEALGSGDFFDDDDVVKALHAIGEPAKQFLLTVLQGKPLNIDNEKAAIALIAFKEDPEVGTVCLKLLHDPHVLKDPALSTYLILGCEELKDEHQRAEFKALAKNPHLLQMLRLDIQAVVNSWNH